MEKSMEKMDTDVRVYMICSAFRNFLCTKQNS